MTVSVDIRLSWSVEDAVVTNYVSQYQLLTWAVADAAKASRETAFTPAVRTHRGLHDDGRTYWIPFYDKSARCSRGPLVNDLYNRYYWTQDGQGLRYATLDSLELDSWTTGLDVGVPPPLLKPSVKVDSNKEPVVTRAYVYTYESVYGEEGQPSPPALATGSDAGEWTLEGMAAAPQADGKIRRLLKKNIYRTITANGTADYHFVDSIGLNETSFVDRWPTDVVALNFTLESEDWAEPPEGLSGLVEHPNGFFVGFVGRDLHFSQPYRPHAWPEGYTLSTLADIVGIGIFGTTLVVCTDSFPYLATGVHPRAIALTKNDTAEPCVSRYGIVSMPFGVYYPSPNGLILASSRGLVNATKELMTKEEWQGRYQVQAFDAARYQSQ
jgi:hypothetical protein